MYHMKMILFKKGLSKGMLIFRIFHMKSYTIKIFIEKRIAVSLSS
jgi:hypothetical protein